MRAFLLLCLVAFAAADVSEVTQSGYNYPQPAGSDGGLMEGAGDAGGMGEDGGLMGGDAGSMGGDDGSMGGENAQMGGDGGSMSADGGAMGEEGGADLGSATDDKPRVSGMKNGSFMGTMGADLGNAALGGPSSPGFGFRESVPMRPDLGYEPVDSAPTVSKRFFTVTADDTGADDEDDDEVSSSSSNKGGHKTYDVIFANNPATSSLKSALKAVYNFAGDHQTSVYVLSQQLGVKQLGAAIKASGIKPSKPQVHFVKYKTPQEAALAQQRIRGQYDQLGGTSENGGYETSPVRSVISGYRRRGPASGSLGGGYGNYGNNAGYGNNNYGNNAGYGARPGGLSYGKNGGYSGRPSGFGGFTQNGGYSARPSGFVSSTGGFGNNGFGGRPSGYTYGYRGGYGGRPSGSSSFGFSNRYLPPRY